jgi:hypothetical protein
MLDKVLWNRLQTTPSKSFVIIYRYSSWLFNQCIWNHVVKYPKNQLSLDVTSQRSSELPSCVITLPDFSFRGKFQNGKATVFVHSTLVRLSTFPPPWCPESGWTLDGVVKLYWKAIGRCAECAVLLAHRQSHGDWPSHSLHYRFLGAQESVWPHFTALFAVLADSYSTDIRRSKSPQGPIQRNDITKHGRC